MLTTPMTHQTVPLHPFAASCSRLLKSWPLRHWKLVVPGVAVVAALLLPTNLLSGQRFHHDEALYATWALQITSGADPWLTHTPIDKPPLFLYLLAGAMGLLGPTETAARIPSLLATALTVLLTFWLGRKLYSDGVGSIAACLVALSPFTLLFAPTAFTDPILVTLVLAACLAAVVGRAGWAGITLGLAVATKQQGVFFIPLVAALLAIYDIVPLGYLRFTSRASRFTLHVSRFFLALLLTLLPIFLWNLTRSPQTPNFLTQSLTNYGGLTTDAASFGERWQGFVELLYYGTGSSVLYLIFAVGLPVLLAFGWWTSRSNLTGDRRPETGEISNPPPTHPSTPPPFHPSILPLLQSSTDLLFTLFILLFLLGHALFSFQIWDRYLLGLMPFLALLLARILFLPWSIIKAFWLDARAGWSPLVGLIYGLVLSVLLILTLAQPVRDAINGRYPLGSHSQAFQGIEQIVAYLQGHAGANHTLYHRWLGTHWRFYLWGYPYDLQYWASPQELAAKAKPGHLIAFPSWESETEARLALAEVNLSLRELSRAYSLAGHPSIVLYEIVSSPSQ